MLDMGFEPQIREILDRCPRNERQTAMFTATWPRGCKALAESYVYQPMQVQVGSEDITTNKNINQHIEVCGSDDDKRNTLKRILKTLSYSGTCLVFCNTKKKCSALAWEL